MEVLTSFDAEVAIVVEENIVSVVDGVEDVVALLNVFADVMLIPFRHEVGKSLLDVAVEFDVSNETCDVAANSEHEVVPRVSFFVESESIFASAGVVDAVGTVGRANFFDGET